MRTFNIHRQKPIIKTAPIQPTNNTMKTTTIITAVRELSADNSPFQIVASLPPEGDPSRSLILSEITKVIPMLPSGIFRCFSLTTLAQSMFALEKHFLAHAAFAVEARPALFAELAKHTLLIAPKASALPATAAGSITVYGDVTHKSRDCIRVVPDDAAGIPVASPVVFIIGSLTCSPTLAGTIVQGDRVQMQFAQNRSGFTGWVLTKKIVGEK